ncbi:MAG: hypothetical protein MUE73_02245, partial [Planctomycetes bacterium]|nr:hypothetical protein [Planctomycetota bacterium]
REFTSLLAWVAEGTERYRAEAARGFCYALRRFTCEEAGTEPPSLTDVSLDGPGGGLPSSFVALVRHRVPMAGAPEPEAGDRATWIPPLPWLRRWARDLTPAVCDLPFLATITREARDLEDRAWALRAAGRIADPGAAGFLARTAAGADETALFAAAELAKDGKPERFRELLAEWRGDEIAEALAFEAIPDEAVRRWIERVAEPPAEDPWDDPLLDPGAEADTERLAAFGVEVGDEMREALAAALPVERMTVETLAWFLTGVSAAPLRGPALEKILARLREYEVAEEDLFDPTMLSELLALLEVRVPDRLVALLHHWVEHREGGLRGRALRTLGFLGDTRFTPELIDLWSVEGEDWYPELMSWLGRVKDPRVAEFLAGRVRAGDPGVAGPAMTALAVLHGLPERLARVFGTVSPDVGAGTFDTARKLLLDGDAIGAVLLLFDPRGPVDLVELGTVADPRAVERLGMLRSDRRAFLEATAGLSLAGDMPAQSDWAGLLRDGRTWLFYPLLNGRAFTFGGDPEWVEFWVDRVDATCCLGFAALEVLGEIFPLLCTREVGRRAEVKDLIERWWRKNRDTLAFSRILDGWIPAR